MPKPITESEIEQVALDKDGKFFSGLDKGFCKNGNLAAELNYMNGHPQGESTHYYENGAIKGTVNYKNGKQDGVCKHYFENGRVEFESVYKNDKQIETKQYNDRGDLIFQGSY